MTKAERDRRGTCPSGFHLRGASIEVCTACNHRCLYCPVSTTAPPQQVMELPLFGRAMKELDDLGVHLRRVSLNHYNEPFLDPLLVDRIEASMGYSFFDVVLLNTNLSVVSMDLIQRLAQFRGRIEFNVNLPTTDRDDYHALHGSDHLDRVMANLEKVLSTCFRTRVNVQRSLLNKAAPFDSTKLPGGVHVDIVQSNSRAGLVSALALGVNYQEKLGGCSISRPTSYVHIGVDGAVFFCCEDYFKRYQIGAITDCPLSAILRSEEMRKYLSYMNGQSNAPADFLCRSCEFVIVGEARPANLQIPVGKRN